MENTIRLNTLAAYVNLETAWSVPGSFYLEVFNIDPETNSVEDWGDWEEMNWNAYLEARNSGELNNKAVRLVYVED